MQVIKQETSLWMKVHHAKMSFREEYEALLVEFGIDPNKDLFLRDE